MKKKIPSLLFLLILLLLLFQVGSGLPAQDEGSQTTPEEELESFVPTEKLPADSAISFPVDI